MKTKVKETINNLTKSQAINWFLSDFLSEELMKYLPKTDVKKLVSKVKDVDFEFVSAKDMQKLHGKKTVPIGTFSAKQNKVFIRETKRFDFETVAHEYIHALSFKLLESDTDQGNYKIGFRERCYTGEVTGHTANELATCYITSKLIGGPGGNYPQLDLFPIMKDMMDINDSETFQMFFMDDEILNKENSDKFNKENSQALRVFFEDLDSRPFKYEEMYNNLRDNIDKSVGYDKNKESILENLNSFAQKYEIKDAEELSN